MYQRQGYLKCLGLSMFSACVWHTFSTAEARFVLNNRLPNFNAYKSTWTMLTSSGDAFTNGWRVNVPRMFILSLSGFNFTTQANLGNFVASQLLFHSLAYPLLTVMRRLQCQSPDRAGMIPMRYEGAIHCLGLMWREEGLRGLYRGYWAYILATAIHHIFVPMTAEFSLIKHPVWGNTIDRTGELLD